jgi:hypothetical protein
LLERYVDATAIEERQAWSKPLPEPLTPASGPARIGYTAFRTLTRACALSTRKSVVDVAPLTLAIVALSGVEAAAQ